jgi:hypothetical protein
MFVRIVFNRAPRAETLIHCDRVSFGPNPGNDDTVYVTMEGARGSESFELEKAESEVYVMNDLGRTIDTHRWAA